MSVTAAHLDRIRACFPTLTLASVRQNSDGLVNDVIIVNDELVFQFPKVDNARAALARDALPLGVE